MEISHRIHAIVKVPRQLKLEHFKPKLFLCIKYNSLMLWNLSLLSVPSIKPYLELWSY